MAGSKVRRRRTAAVVLIVATCALLGAQSGSGAISGLVVTDEPQPVPVRRAVVTLSGGDLTRSRAAVTDDSGRFVLTGIPTGRFTLTVSKPSFITNAYGARRPGRPGTPVVLTAGQEVQNLRVVLPRGAVVAGIIRDERGEPVAGLPIQVLLPSEAARAASQSSLASASLSQSSLATPTVTDDRGAYRIFGLPPGDYVVMTSLRTVGLNAAMGMLSTSEIDAAFRELQAARTRGRGPGTPPAPTAPSTTPLRSDPTSVFAPVFYPGTPIAAEARVITLASGEERGGLDFVVRPSRTASISGIVVGASGGSSDVNVTMSADGAGSSASPFGISVRSVRPGADGRFKLENIAPGSYRLEARTGVAGGPGGAVFGGRAVGSPGVAVASTSGPPQWALARLTVNGQNIDAVSLVLQPAMTFAARVAFEATVLTPPSDLSTLRLTLADLGGGQPRVSAPSPAGGTAGVTGASSNGSFEIAGILPGSYRLELTVPAQGWWLRSAMVGGRDVLDAGLEFGQGGDIRGAVLTLTDRHSELSGTLQTPAGSPATEYFVVAIPADRAFWRPAARRMRTARPATDGRFVIRDLPGGDYVVAALVDVEPADLDDTRFLEQVALAGVKLVVRDGETTTQNLQIAR